MPPKAADGSWVDGGGVRVEANVKLPQGTPSGTWPAFWMLPTDNVRTHTWLYCVFTMEYVLIVLQDSAVVTCHKQV